MPTFSMGRGKVITRADCQLDGSGKVYYIPGGASHIGLEAASLF